MASTKPPSTTRGTRRSRRRSPGLSRKAGIWLATLSTVVGVATGMFTLRDQVFPREAGTASAGSEPDFRADVGRVCDEVNDNERERRRADRTLAKRLRRARTPVAQGDALLDAARGSTARSQHALEQFGALEPPRPRVADHRGVTGVWGRNLDRLLDYVERLDRARDYDGVMKAVHRLSRMRSALARDGRAINTGLERLGGDRCEIDAPVVSPTIRLPVLEPKPTPKPTPTVNPSVNGPTATATPFSPSVNTPTPSARPRVNTPSTQSPSPVLARP